MSTFLFAGGGSGGHISPGLAIAERLHEIEPANRSIFLCSNRAIDGEMLEDAGAEFIALPATPPARNPISLMRFLLNFQRSRSIVRRLIVNEKPAHLIALGGFVAAPAVSAAAGKVPVTLVNLDAPPGKANRLMAAKCDEVLSAIEVPMMPHFAKRIVGMPIRRSAIASAGAAECREKLGLDPGKQTLIVTGASQGATSINEMMMQIARTDGRLLKGNRQVLHLTGAGADDPVRQAYEGCGISAVVLPFLNEMGLAWGAAGSDGLAISRAGASSVAEAWANSVPTIFLPYPFHKDEHQKHNAKPMVEVGGAVIVKDRIDPQANAKAIAPALQRLFNDRLELKAMRARLQRTAPRDAAAVIAKRLLGKEPISSGTTDRS